MNRLIVDDNRYVVEGLKGQIQQLQLDIDGVFGCYSVSEAKNIFLSQPIDLLLSDIEMPGEDGFALLEWLRWENLTPITVLLTSYAEFSYAQRSVEYGVSGYLLKPLSSDALRQALTQMIEKYEKQHQDKQRMNFGDKWLNQQRKTRFSYWRQLLRAVHSASASSVRMLLSTRPAFIDPEGRYVPICMNISCGSTSWSPELIAYSSENVLMELAQEMGLGYEVLYHVEQAVYVLILRMLPGKGPEEIEMMMSLFADFFHDGLDMTVRYVLREIHVLEQLPGASGISLPESRIRPGTSPELPFFRFEKPDTEDWKRLILSGDLDALREAVTEYLRKEFNPEYAALDFVGAFQVDWHLLVNSILKENTNLSITELRRGGFSRWLTTDMELLVQLVMEDATELTKLLDIDGFSSLNVARIRSYIRDNIADVTRNSIAEHFHFSPNYLSKLFRNVEGVSLITYIQNQRMERAKELLANTDQSISEIAMEIGYPNFSHFSKRFRLFFGCSPNEYRRNARANTKKGSSQ